MIVLASPSSLKERRLAPLGVAYLAQRDAAREMRAALLTVRTAINTGRLQHSPDAGQPERVAIADAINGAINAAERAGITEGS